MMRPKCGFDKPLLCVSTQGAFGAGASLWWRAGRWSSSSNSARQLRRAEFLQASERLAA